MDGFFSAGHLVQTAAKPMAAVPNCPACRLYVGCKTPRMEPTGYGGPGGLLFLVHGPDVAGDYAGRYIGNDAMVPVIGQVPIEWRPYVTVAGVTACTTPGGREPTDAEVEHCSPQLVAVLARLQPTVVVTLGAVPTAAVRTLTRGPKGPVDRFYGYQIPLAAQNAWFCPTYHMADLITEKKTCHGVHWQNHLQAAMALLGTRPWGSKPVYPVEFLSGATAADAITTMVANLAPVAFDYETNSLKPETPGARIYTVALCDGRRTIATPWGPDVAAAMRQFLATPLPKIAANMKFEERWSRVHLGLRVAGWYWDTMQAAHVMDHRRGVTALDFVAYTRLGVGGYSAHLEDLMHADDGTGINRIRDIAIADLLQYNGFDAAYEYWAAGVQMREFGYPLPEGYIANGNP